VCDQWRLCYVRRPSRIAAAAAADQCYLKAEYVPSSDASLLLCRPSSVAHGVAAKNSAADASKNFAILCHFQVPQLTVSLLYDSIAPDKHKRSSAINTR